jgi:hypothetical protein
LAPAAGGWWLVAATESPEASFYPSHLVSCSSNDFACASQFPTFYLFLLPQSPAVTMLSILRKSRLKDKEMRVLMLGLDNAGKTTIVKSIMEEDVHTVSPTLGFIIKTIDYQGCVAPPFPRCVQIDWRQLPRASPTPANSARYM